MALGYMLKGSLGRKSPGPHPGEPWDEAVSWRMYSPSPGRPLPVVLVCMSLFVLRLKQVTCPPPGLSPDLQSMEQIRRIMRPTDVPDQGLLCDLLWSDPDKDVQGWGENDRGVSFTFGAEVVAKFLHKHDLDLICRAHQVGWQLWGGWEWGLGSQHLLNKLPPSSSRW